MQKNNGEDVPSCDKSPIDGGIVPVILFLLRLSTKAEVILDKLSGIVEVKLLSLSCSRCSSGKRPIESGTGPLISLNEILNRCRCDNRMKASPGKVPPRSLFDNARIAADSGRVRLVGRV